MPWMRWGLVCFALVLAGCLGDMGLPTLATPDPACSGSNYKTRPRAELVRWPYLQSVTPNSAIIAWGTRFGGTDSLYFGESGVTLNRSQTAQSAAVSPGKVLHQVQLRGLKPGTKYCYEIRQNDAPLITSLSFHTAPTEPSSPVKFIVLGDFGRGSRAQYELRDVLAHYTADLWLTTGDNAYSDGTHNQLDSYVFGPYRDMWTRTPVYPSIGNHDERTESAGPYLANFFLPENAHNHEDSERYYSFDWGSVHFVALDSERSLRGLYRRPELMIEWLKADLLANQQKWIVVYLHRPAYSADGVNGDDHVRRHLVPILEKYGVNVVFAGHTHVYERFQRIREGLPADDGVLYITTGGGGARLEPTRGDKLLAVAASRHHFVYVDADACRFRLRAIDVDGDEFDRFVLDRCTVSRTLASTE